MSSMEKEKEKEEFLRSIMESLLTTATHPPQKENQDQILSRRHRYPSHHSRHGGEIRNPDLYQKLRDDCPYLIPGMCSVTHYQVRKGQSSSENYRHRVLFKDDVFTFDGKSYRKVDDPVNAPFLESIKKGRCPDEFQGEGIHLICLMRDEDMSWEELEAEVNVILPADPPPDFF